MTSRVLSLMSLILGIGLVSGIAGAHPGQDKDKEKKQTGDGLPMEVQPKPITLKGEEVPLSRALKELARQTGNNVEDRRKSKDDPKLNLNLKNVNFWPALELIAREADARISIFENDRRVALVDGPYLAQPYSYHGMFRVGYRGIDAIRKLEPAAHYCVVHLELAWEPRFQPFMVDAPSQSLVAQDDKGNNLGTAENDRGGPLPVGRGIATEIEVRVPAPRRASPHFGMLKGEITVVGPTKMITFNFAKLGKIEKKNEIRKETLEDVTVSLRKFLMEGESGEQLWTVEVLLEYPEDGPKFESFQSWLVNNEAYLEKDGGKERCPVNGGYETDDTTETKAVLRYRFTDEVEKKIILGKPGDWSMVYKTPGKIVEVPVPFEFKEVPLP